MEDSKPRHLNTVEPSPWVVRFAPLIAAGGTVLDLACGGGRHGRHMLGRDCTVTLVDRDVSAVDDINDPAGAQVIEADLETGDDIFTGSGPLAERHFDGIIVVNYLHRPLFGGLLDALNDGGILIYETFARGNEQYTRPRNPDHLLKSGELLNLVKGRMQVIAYEHGIVEKGDEPGVISGVVQRICAVTERGRSSQRRSGSRPGRRPDRREDSEPQPRAIHPL